MLSHNFCLMTECVLRLGCGKATRGDLWFYGTQLASFLLDLGSFQKHIGLSIRLSTY